MSIKRVKSRKKSPYFKPIVRISATGTNVRLYKKTDGKEEKIVDVLITKNLKNDILQNCHNLESQIGSEALNKIVTFAISERRLIEKHLKESILNNKACARPLIPINTSAKKKHFIDNKSLHELEYPVYEFSEILINEQDFQFEDISKLGRVNVNKETNPLDWTIKDIITYIAKRKICSEEMRVKFIALEFLLQKTFNFKKGFEIGSGSSDKIKKERLSRKVKSEEVCEDFVNFINESLLEDNQLRLQYTKGNKKAIVKED